MEPKSEVERMKKYYPVARKAESLWTAQEREQARKRANCLGGSSHATDPDHTCWPIPQRMDPEEICAADRTVAALIGALETEHQVRIEFNEMTSWHEHKQQPCEVCVLLDSLK